MGVCMCVSLCACMCHMRLSAANETGCFPAVSLRRALHMLLQHHSNQCVTTVNNRICHHKGGFCKSREASTLACATLSLPKCHQKLNKLKYPHFMFKSLTHPEVESGEKDYIFSKIEKDVQLP